MNFLYNQIKTYIDITKPLLKDIQETYEIEDELYDIYLKDFENTLKLFRKNKKKSDYSIFCKNNRKIIKEKYKDILDKIDNNDILYKTKAEKSKAKFSFITKKISQEWKIQKSLNN